jgi:hypothetical protein
LNTAEFYRLSAQAAGQMLDSLRAVVREWQALAKTARLAASEIAAVETAFALS